jgi:hypothetical protein
MAPAICHSLTRLVASTCGDGLAVADGRHERVEVVESPGARAIAGSRGDHVVVLSGAPRPGVQVVDVRGCSVEVGRAAGERAQSRDGSDADARGLSRGLE